MNPEMENLDLPTLETRYQKELQQLNTQLLSGAQWNEVADQRKIVTDLSIALHRKLASMNFHPAEHSSGEIQRRK